MTQPADLTHAVLARLTQFVRRLSPGDLADLVAGSARLELVRPTPAPAFGATPGAATTANPAAGASVAAPREPSVPAEVVREALGSLSDRGEAIRYLDGLRLTTPQLRALAKAFNLAVASRAGKTELRDTIVQWTVGRRVDAAVLSRPGG